MSINLADENGVYILGAGGLGREIVSWNSISNKPVTFLGFIDDCAEEINYEIETATSKYKVFSVKQAVSRLRGKPFIPAIANPELKKSLVEKLTSAGMKLSSYIDTSSKISPDVSLSTGIIICPDVTVSTNVSINTCVLLNVGTRVGHDCKIGSFSSLLGGNLINGEVSIGDLCLLGAGAIIHPRVIIGNSATAGLGSVVIRNVKPGTTVFGNPAQQL